MTDAPTKDKTGKLADAQVFRLIKSLDQRYEGKNHSTSDTTPDPMTFSGRIDWRRQHLHNVDDVDPPLADPWNDGPKDQHDILRKIYVEMVARLTENPVTIDVGSPKENATTDAAGDDFATVLQEIWRDVQQRLQINIQESVSAGQVAEAFGLIHLRMDASLVPEVPDPETLDTLPDCPMCEGTKKAAGKKCPECGGTGTDASYLKTHKKQGDKYVERADALNKRTAQARAKAGTPFYVEMPDIAGYRWETDRSGKPGDRFDMLIRKVSLLDYCDANGEAGELTTEEIEAEAAAPRAWMPSWINWDTDQGKDIIVYEFWTRDEYYEVVAQDGDDGMVVRKSFPHFYGRPLFWRIPAIEYNSADPMLKYEPLMEGLYRKKQAVDRINALFAVMAEKTALPYYYWKNTTTGAPALSEDGLSEIRFSRDSAAANKAPQGYELVKADPAEIQQALVEMRRDAIKDLLDAAPPTGQAEVTATTQPFAIKLQQEQASTVLKAVLRKQVAAFQSLFDCIAMLLAKPVEEGGYGETLYVNPSSVTSDGRRITDRSKTIGVDPKVIETLTINVNISGTSAAEQTTKTQIGIQLLGDPAIPLTRKYVLQNYFGIDRAEDMLEEWDSEQIFITKVKPGLIDRELAKKYGGVFVVTPDGSPVGFGGKAVTPQDVLQQNGITPVVPPQQGGGVPPAGMSPTPGAPPPPPPTQMAPPGPLQVPGSLPTPGTM